MYSGGACCGFQCVYAIGVARASSPLGPVRGGARSTRSSHGERHLALPRPRRRGPGRQGRHVAPLPRLPAPRLRLRRAGRRCSTGCAGAAAGRGSARDSEPTSARRRAPSTPQRRTEHEARRLRRRRRSAASWQWGEGTRPSDRACAAASSTLAPPPRGHRRPRPAQLPHGPLSRATRARDAAASGAPARRSGVLGPDRRACGSSAQGRAIDGVERGAGAAAEADRPPDGSPGSAIVPARCRRASTASASRRSADGRNWQRGRLGATRAGHRELGRSALGIALRGGGRRELRLDSP